MRDERLGISVSTLKALNRCRDQGIMLGICTGRTLGIIPSEILNIGFEVIISGGGNVVTVNEKVIKEVYFKASLVNLFQELFEDYPYSLETPETVYMNEEAAKILTDMNKLKGIIDLSNEPIVYQANLQDFEYSMKVSKICLWSKVPLQQLLKVFIDDIEFAQFKEELGQCYYEIINRDCHKGEAIKKVREELLMEKKEVLCFGDGRNDIEMFKACGTAVAMANSEEALMMYANTVCEAVDRDGIYLELRRRGII